MRAFLIAAFVFSATCLGYAQADANNGWLVRGMTANAVWRTDATIATESPFPFITLFRTTLPGDIYGESSVSSGAYDSGGHLQKQAGVNFLWKDASPDTGWACARIHASQLYGGGVNLEFVVANFCGGHGASLFDMNTTDMVPDRLNVYGNIHVQHSANQNGRINAEGFEVHDAVGNTDVAGITVSGSTCIITRIQGGIVTEATCQ